MTVSIWQANGSQPYREVDVLIIGGGLIGCSAAYFASQAGRHVTLTEMRDLGLGASSRNAGFMLTGLDTYYHQAIARWGHPVVREMWDISVKTHAYWRQFARAGGVQFADSGSLLLAETPEEARDLELAARALDADKRAVHFHATDPLHRGYHAAIEYPQDGMIQPYDLVQAIFKQSGAALINNNEVYAIAQESPDYVDVHSRQYRFRARYVLICTNAYSGSLDPYFIDKVEPIRAQVLVTAKLNAPVMNCPGYSDYGYMYYRETFDGRLLIGGGRKQNKPGEGNTTDDRVTDPVQRILDAYLKRWFPDVDVPVERRWAGIMGFSVDGLPLVGTLPRKPRVGFAVGFTGHGLSSGAAVAERAVDLLLNGANPGVVSATRLG
jgi:glycine/D-amino acid oxidase-like deaminating enzyme